MSCVLVVPFSCHLNCEGQMLTSFGQTEGQRLSDLSMKNNYLIVKVVSLGLKAVCVHTQST